MLSNAQIRISAEADAVAAPRLQSPTHDSASLLELDNLGLVYLMVGLGFVGIVTELAMTTFVPRLVLYALVLAMGAVGLIRRYRNARHARLIWMRGRLWGPAPGDKCKKHQGVAASRTICVSSRSVGRAPQARGSQADEA